MKKISSKDVAYIKNYKKNHFIDKLVKWTIEEDNTSITVKGKWRLPVKTILFIPISCITIIHSLWEGGLKEGIADVKSMWYIHPDKEYQNFYENSRYSRMRKIVDKY